MFKVPSTIAQDLLLIQDLVSDSGPSRASAAKDVKACEFSESIDSSCASSDSEAESEEVEVVESLLERQDALEEVVDVNLQPPPSFESSDDDSNSDSGSDVEPHKAGKRGRPSNDELEDEDEDVEDGARHAADSALRTKNEFPEPLISVPDIVEVGANEHLENVGEIMSVIDNVVVVKGIASDNENRASERALDSESLLVFEDRKVLGYVHETFGPTHQPLYQVKFPSSASIDKEMATISRAVFHVPNRSNFVFPSQLNKLKGSDASNVHDEEVNEDEIEFSDDEAEMAYKQQRRRQRESYRKSSVSSSRFSTPTPSQMHDHELVEETFYGTSPFDKYGPYDMDVLPGSSRPAPLPYDDPYEDSPTSVPPVLSSAQTTERRPGPSVAQKTLGREHTRGRGRGRGRERGRGRGRGREDGREYHVRGGGGGGGGDRKWSSGSGPFGGRPSEPRGRRASISRGDSAGPSIPRSVSPTSLAIARATGQFTDGSAFANAQAPVPSPAPALPTHGGGWQQQSAAYGQFDTSQQLYSGQPSQQQTYVQPHINPRFASVFGIDMNFIQAQQYSPFPASGTQNVPTYGAHQNATWTSNSWPQNVSTGITESGTVNEFAVQTKNESDEYHP